MVEAEIILGAQDAFLDCPAQPGCGRQIGNHRDRVRLD
jgi:hypothetical protein